MRKIEETDLLDKNILPIYSKNKVAFLCVVESVVLIFNSQSVFCNAYIVEFREIPRQLIHRNKSLLLRSRQHQFIKDIKIEPSTVYVEDFKEQMIQNTHWDNLEKTIRQLQLIHYAFGSMILFIQQYSFVL